MHFRYKSNGLFYWIISSVGLHQINLKNFKTVNLVFGNQPWWEKPYRPAYTVLYFYKARGGGFYCKHSSSSKAALYIQVSSKGCSCRLLLAFANRSMPSKRLSRQPKGSFIVTRSGSKVNRWPMGRYYFFIGYVNDIKFSKKSSERVATQLLISVGKNYSL